MGVPIDLAAAYEAFEASTDGTVGLEEELAICDPRTLELVPRFEELRDAAAAEDAVLAASISGELIRSEIEIRSGRGEDLQHAIARQRDARLRLCAAPDARHKVHGSTGTHGRSDNRDPEVIATEH